MRSALKLYLRVQPNTLQRPLNVALADMRKNARALTALEQTSPRAAKLFAQFRLIARQTDIHAGNYLNLMAKPNNAMADASVRSHNKLVEYTNAANRERRKLD